MRLPLAQFLFRKGSAPLINQKSAVENTLPRVVSSLFNRRRLNFWIGLTISLIIILIAIVGHRISPFPQDKILTGPPLSAPDMNHIFGTDELGRDLLSRILSGTRLTLQFSLMAVVLSAGIGITSGLMAGYFSKTIDQILSRIVDIWLAIPGLLFAIIIVARLGPSLFHTSIALGIVGIPSFFRMARSGSLSAKEQQYVLGARALGATNQRILIRHILPNIAHSLIVLITSRIGTMILAAGGLSFIGLGAQPPQPEWGALLAHGRDYIHVAPWLAIYPGLWITLTVLGVNLLGDGLCDLLDRRR